MPLATVRVRRGQDLDVGIAIAIRATGQPATGKTVRAWLSDEQLHDTNNTAEPLDPSVEVSPLTEVEDDPDFGHAYTGAIDRAAIDDHVYGATPAFGFGSSRKLYLHWDDGEGFHDWAPCKVEGT